MKKKTPVHNIGIVSLGCAKNLVDTEVLMKQLEDRNVRLFFDPAEDDLIDTVIINTCGFILDAKQESIDTILQFVQKKKRGNLKSIFVMGCLSQRYKEELAREIPEVDGFFGVSELSEVITRAGGLFKSDQLDKRFITTPGHYSYLKIGEGCSRLCSFCSIPLIRGNHISKPVEIILLEAENLIKDGIKEINLISQDTTFYGMDLYKKRKLPELVRKLASIKELEWLRIHYTYPDGFPLDLLEVISSHKNICKYIDIPLQHISSRILKSMKRGLNEAETRDLLSKIRSSVPGICIRTTFIVGYPGETEPEFLHLVDFVKESRFGRLGVFTYSHEEGTPAYRLKDDVPEKEKQRRAEFLMKIQENISLEMNEELVSKVLKVIIDRKEGDYYIGRSEFDSPDVDQEIIIPVTEPLIPGNFYNIRIMEAAPFELSGKLLD